MVQRVKDPVLSLLWRGFDPWPRKFHMLWTWPEKKKKKERKSWGPGPCHGLSLPPLTQEPAPKQGVLPLVLRVRAGHQDLSPFLSPLPPPGLVATPEIWLAASFHPKLLPILPSFPHVVLA